MEQTLPPGQRRQLWLFLAPPIVYLIIFFVLPLLIVFAVSFTVPRPNGGIDWVFTFQNYLDALNPNNPVVAVFGRSLRIGLLTTLFCFLIGYPMAFFIATRPPRWRAPLLMAVMIPFWTNFVIRTYAWLLLLRPGGLINSALGLTDNPLQMVGTEAAVILVLVYSWLPDMVLPTYAAIERLDKRLVEAAKDLYANEAQAFLRVVLPLTAPGIAAGSILVFIPALGAYIVPLIIGLGQQPMIGTMLERQFLSSRNWPFGSALAFGIMAIMLVGTLIYFRTLRQQTATR